MEQNSYMGCCFRSLRSLFTWGFVADVCGREIKGCGENKWSKALAITAGSKILQKRSFNNEHFYLLWMRVWEINSWTVAWGMCLVLQISSVPLLQRGVKQAEPHVLYIAQMLFSGVGGELVSGWFAWICMKLFYNESDHWTIPVQSIVTGSRFPRPRAFLNMDPWSCKPWDSGNEIWDVRGALGQLSWWMF